MHLCMMIWFYKVPFGYRRRMIQRDIDYRKQLKLHRYTNGYLENMKNKEKFTLVNVEDMKTRNDINKDRIVDI